MQTLPIDTSKVRFRALTEPIPQSEWGSSAQKVTANGELVFRVRMLISTDEGGEVVWVKVPGCPDGIEPDALCEVEGLRLLPWARDDKSGVAFWCDSIEAVEGLS